ncbi:hypothetical protein PRK78_005326 [Emydomyces testavorans]|uniref:DNA-directed RNA polymerase subunit n=1 Tax=Emydomyces testavorans TaxID=2070801 RepID=A0AAF0IJE7_9EURO|nr:hypothetical protein PRK78_005326 [Emydomyces testavorans]
MEAASTSSLVKKRKINDEDHRSSKKRKHHDDDQHSTPKQKKKDKHHRKHKDNTSLLHPESPSASRKPLSKSTPSQLISPESLDSSPFHLVKTTLYLPLSPISISPTHALPGLLSEHITPLLLTYYPPLRGIILAFSNASISSTPLQPPSNASQKNSTIPEPLTLAVTAGEYGVLYVYLTLTFLIFRPERGQTLEGWINVQSEGFLGAVVFNLFSVGIERKRLPPDWTWIAAGEERQQQQQPAAAEVQAEEDSDHDSDKENFRPLKGTKHIPDEHEDEAAAAMGYFQTRSGKRVRGTIRFRVRDVDVIPGSEQDKGFISLEGTMLSPEDEAKLVDEEKKRVLGLLEQVTDIPGNDDDVMMVSGGLADEESRTERTGKVAEKEKKKRKKKSKE